MGLCWSTTLPEDDEADPSTDQYPKCLANNSRTAKKVVEFGREEVRLNELLATLRTGLVFAPTEFSVLPGGLSTTAKLSFEVGNSELQRRQEAVHLKKEDNIMAPDEDGSTVGEEGTPDPQPFKLKMTLEGYGWARKLVMTLYIEPVVGQFAGRKLQFHWRDDALNILGTEQGELDAHSLPISFQDEVEFCVCCLQLTYQSKRQLTHEVAGEDAECNALTTADAAVVPSLKYGAYRMTVANLDVLAGRLHTIPAKLYHMLFGSQDPVDISLTLWPRNANVTTLTLKVKSGILFAELVYLIQEHLHCESNQVLKLYSNFRPINSSEVVSEETKNLDCFIIDRKNPVALSASCTSLNEASNGASEKLVLSLVGKKIQSMEADLDMLMEEFDALIRHEFNLKKDSFLIILSEDDLAPQYMADDNWKCTYTFSIPDNSFGAGLRRSLRRLSGRRHGAEGRPHTPTSEADTSTFAPQMAEVIELLSSNERRFPRNGKRCGLSVEELYQSMPIYRTSIEQCGIHQYSMTQVFEVTGPSIPITVRVISGYNKDDSQQHVPNAPRTRLANIMDINPDWSVSTFLKYIDAVVSLSSASRQRKLWLKDNWVDYKTDLSKLTLGALLDSWKPLWWAENGGSRRQLTTKDIDPSEYLVVEKF